jgi:hypothetical protein
MREEVWAWDNSLWKYTFTKVKFRGDEGAEHSRSITSYDCGTAVDRATGGGVSVRAYTVFAANDA